MARGIVAVFRCRITGGTATPQTGETTALRWLIPSDIPELMDEAYTVRLLDALHDGPPAVRSHDGYRLVERDMSFRVDVVDTEAHREDVAPQASSADSCDALGVGWSMT